MDTRNLYQCMLIAKVNCKIDKRNCLNYLYLICRLMLALEFAHLMIVNGGRPGSEPLLKPENKSIDCYYACKNGKTIEIGYVQKSVYSLPK